MRPLSIASVFTTLGLFAASATTAAIPSPANSTIPTHIHVVGRVGAQPDTAAGRFVVVARDLANNPMVGSTIVVDFWANPDVKLSSDMLDPTLTVNCAQRTVRAYTNTRGEAFFTIVGTGTVTPQGSSVASTRIYQDGMLLGSVPASVFDLDAVGGLGANDLSMWLNDFGVGTYAVRGDYDASGFLGANDLSVWLDTFGRAASSQSAPPGCP